MGDHELSLKCYYFRRKERQLLRDNYQALPHSSLQPSHNDWHIKSWHTTNTLFLKSTQLKKIKHLLTVSCLKFTFLCFKIPSQASAILFFKSYFLIFKGQLSVLHKSTGLVTQLLSLNPNWQHKLCDLRWVMQFFCASGFSGIKWYW